MVFDLFSILESNFVLMEKVMKKIITLLFAGLLPLHATAAGYVTNAKITSLYCGYVNSYKTCSITFDKPIINKDACHTGSERMQFQPNTDIGKAMLSVALAAQATKQNVEVYSTGSCTIYPGFADVNWITIQS